MTLPAAVRDDSAERLAHLSTLARDVLRRCAARGATQAEVSLNEDRGLSVNVRLGEVETVERTRDRGVAVTVYFGQRKGSASTADLQPGSVEATVAQACAIARHTESDPAAGLADADRMATEVRDFDGWHPWDVDAGRGDDMQREHWYTTALSPDDLEAPVAVGRRAAERTVSRLDPRPLKTGDYPVLFAPETARSLVGHLLAAISGGNLYRRASFLVDQAGERILPPWFRILERPHLPRGLRSGSFDAEGVATVESPIVDGGVLQRYLLGSYSARKLGLRSTGNAGGVHNLEVAANAADGAAIARAMGRGLLVTDLMGQGANTVTGDYSRGAAGFWIENGEIAHAVDELTIAGRLQDVFLAIEAVGADVDRRSHIGIGSLLVGRMTVAGES